MPKTDTQEPKPAIKEVMELMGHDMKGPMAVIRGKMTATDEQVFEALARTDPSTSSGQALRALADKMLYELMVEIRDSLHGRK